MSELILNEISSTAAIHCYAASIDDNLGYISTFLDKVEESTKKLGHTAETTKLGLLVKSVPNEYEVMKLFVEKDKFKIDVHYKHTNTLALANSILTQSGARIRQLEKEVVIENLEALLKRTKKVTYK